jgi:hypothetical protein
LKANSARRGLDGVADPYRTERVVDEVASEIDLTFVLSVGRERTQRLLAPGARSLVDRGYGAARARLGNSERHGPYPETAPAVLGVGFAALEDEVWSEAVHGQGFFLPAVEVFERGFGDQEEREPVGEADLIPTLRKRRVDQPGIVVGLVDEPAGEL